ncbi:MAG: AsmA family protein, partial [Oxalobacteraceae bacterium]|nr:AsmA family protein [Oxalobacteraceae bacterium]
MISLVAMAVLMLAVLLAAFAGIELDGDRFRAPVNHWLSAQLGREARIDGQLRLKLGVRPGLLVRQLRVAQPTTFGSGDFLNIGELRFELDLMPLLHGQLRAERLSASAVRLDLRQTAAGAANWRFDPAKPEISSQADAQETGAAEAAKIAAHIDIRELQIAGLQIRFQDEGAKPVHVALDSFDARLPADAGLIATAKGRVQQTMEYQLRISGGSLRELALGDPRWPLNMQLEFAGSTLSLNGHLGSAKTQLRFGLGTTDIARFGKLLNIDFPDTGVAGIGGQLTLTPGSVRIDDISAQLGLSSLRGSLMMDLRSQRPRLEGELDIARLDLRPFLGQDKDEDTPTDLPELYRSLSRAKLDLSALDQ